jgi:hypothetical protein
MSSIIRVRNADIVCSFVIDGTTRLETDDSLTSYPQEIPPLPLGCAIGAAVRSTEKLSLVA